MHLTPSKPSIQDERGQAGFPLASLALLVTALACLLACVDVHRLRAQYTIALATGIWQLFLLFGVAGVFGAIIGLVYMLRRPFSWKSFITAPCMGILAGEAGGLILLAPGALWRTILAVSVLLVAAIFIRLGAD